MSQKKEKLVLKISLWAGVLFVLIEIFMAIYSKSQAVLADSIFDGVELIVIVISIRLIPILHRPVTEKNPYGFSQMESLFIVFKGFMMFSVTGGLIINNIQIILNGGNAVNNMQVSIFEFILTFISLIVYLSMKKLNKNNKSPMILLEIEGWKIDFLCGLAVAISFIIPSIIKTEFIHNISPYLDQIVVIILIILILPEPLKIFFSAFRDIFLFAPDVEVLDEIKKYTKTIFIKYGYEATFFEVTKTGRKIWIEIYFKTENDDIKLSKLKEVTKILSKIFKDKFEYVHLQLVPDVEN